MKRIVAVMSAVLFLAGIVFSAVAQASLPVGIVLPTKDEPRWLQDEARFKAALTAAGYNAEVLFSQGDSAKEKANVESLITKGIKVLIICPQDGTAAAAAADAANRAGVKVISYDRLIRETASVDYYVTFDSFAVGAAWGDYLVKNASGKGNNLYLYAGAASDNNAFIFFDGAWSVLQPKIADGTFVVQNSSEAIKLMGKAKLSREELGKIIGQVSTDWSFSVAKNKAEADMTKARRAAKGTVFICAPNDGTARAIADVYSHRPRREEVLHHGPGRRGRLHPVHHQRQAVHDRSQGRPRPGQRRHRRRRRLPQGRYSR